MPILHLNHQQALALIEEMTSTRNLLAYGTRVIRTAPFRDTTRDPILTMLSIGIEKLYKLTLGLAALDTNRSWPSKGEMKKHGHNLADMHPVVMAELTNRAANCSKYVRRMLAEVQADEAIPPLIATLSRYGESGRFYYLDTLGDVPQPFESPRQYWQKIEDVVILEPVVAAAFASAMADSTNNDQWNLLNNSINQRIADSVERLWTTIAVCGRNHALGEAGTVFGFEIHPEAVGRQ